MPHITTNFSQLLKLAESRQGRNIPYREITAATGVAASTLSAYAKNNVRLYNTSTVARLCIFFECTPGEFLELHI